MPTLEHLKAGLKRTASNAPKIPLTDLQYGAGFKLLLESGGWQTYKNFILPQLTKLMSELTVSRPQISVLEIGPGLKSVLESLPGREKIGQYTAFEPNQFFAMRLEGRFKNMTLHRTPFTLEERTKDHTRSASEEASAREEQTAGTGLDTNATKQTFDLILFCHSMYGMSPKRKFIEKALGMLAEGGQIAVFHREGLEFDGLVCHRTASWPTGFFCLPANNTAALDRFAPFIAGFSCTGAASLSWRDVCRSLGQRADANSAKLHFEVPERMTIFNQNAALVSKIMAVVPCIPGKHLTNNRPIKNREVQNRHPACVVKPVTIEDVQQCVRFALNSGTSLTVLGGGHSGHCVVPDVVAVDMSEFCAMKHLNDPDMDQEYFVVGTGCKSGDVIQMAESKGLTIPLGSRPSVGAGLRLQGGIGHLSRSHGLTCDSIVGAVIVSVANSEVLCIGTVSEETCLRAGAIRPSAEVESELLWAIRGAGTNFDIVTEVTFKAVPSAKYAIQNWTGPLDLQLEVEHKLAVIDNISRQLVQDFSADIYLYVDKLDSIQLGVTIFANLTGDGTLPSEYLYTVGRLNDLLGLAGPPVVKDGVGLFEADKYMSAFGGEHDGMKKTSSFKRCLFLRSLRDKRVIQGLIAAMTSRPNKLCYLQLLHGDGKMAEIRARDTAFGCRDWDYACVITGIWHREYDGNDAAQSVAGWVYKVAESLLPLVQGVYSADLGPDPRDSTLAVKAFGPNRPRLARLKRKYDPQNVLAYACPLPDPRPRTAPRLVVIVSGMHGHGKDYTAEVWTSYINNLTNRSLEAQVSSISEVTKRKYAAAHGADITSLLHDRAYKDRHRERLTAFWKDELEKNPELPQEYFRECVNGAEDADIVFVTGLTESNPVAVMSQCFPDCRLIEVSVRLTRPDKLKERSGSTKWEANTSPPTGLVFNNDSDGHDAAERFVEKHFLPFFDDKLERLRAMVGTIPNFPAPEVNFQHILGIAEHREGLPIAIDLLQQHCVVDWSKIDAIVSCEAGGFIFASALASRLHLPLAVTREAGKLPPPTLSNVVSTSFISSVTSGRETARQLEMRANVVEKNASVVVIDDVLSTGRTMCAVLELLKQAGVPAANITVAIVAEFPEHGGRNELCQRGFGEANVKSLLVFPGK